MNWREQWRPLAAIVAVFLLCYYLPVEQIAARLPYLGWERLNNAVLESLYLVRWYAREHVILCLIPAFFIAGAIGAFVSQAAVMKYLGAKANKVLAYGVASVSGTVLAVCSCTVLPLFAGIYRMGAGLGPAVAFLYSGPAINVLAIVLTARVLGLELGIARAVGAVIFSVVIGLTMHLMFRREEMEKAQAQMLLPEVEVPRPLWQTVLYFAAMVAILVFANWGRPAEAEGLWQAIYEARWTVVAVAAAALAGMLIAWFRLPAWQVVAIALATAAAAVAFPSLPTIPFLVGFLGLSAITSVRDDENGEWFAQSWTFAKQILPLLLMGVLVAGALLGRPEQEGLIPSEWVATAVGGNSLRANFFAAFAGAFMYFATLTEVPILQGLLGSGMGKGPALALLLAGPALSLPNMLVIRSVLGTKKTFVFIVLVVVMATASGMIFGILAGEA